MKDYLVSNYDGIYIYIYIPTFVFLSIAYIYLFGKFVSKNKNVLIVGCFFWFFRVLIGYIAPLLSFFPDFGDTNLFSIIIKNNYFPPEQSNGVKNYYYLTYALRLISLNDIQTFILYQEFFYCISILIILIAFKRWLDFNNANINNDSILIYLILAAVYPASMMYISVPLREFLIVFAISIFLFGSVDYITNKRRLILLIGMVLVTLVRPQLLPAFILTLYLVKYHSRWYHYAPLIFMPPFLLMVFSTVFYSIDPAKLAYIRSHWSELYSQDVYGVFEWNSWLDVIMDMPLLLLQYLLSPFPILHSRPLFSMLGGTLDLIYLVLVYICSIRLIKRKYKFLVFSPFFIMAIVTILMSSLWEAYIGGAIRHRMISIIPLLPLVSFYFFRTRECK